MDFEVINTKTSDELLKAITANQGNNFRIGAGFTDLINQLKNQNTEDLTIINISQIKDSSFKEIKVEKDCVRIGTLATASDIVANSMIKENFPVLHQAASQLACTQIRNVATLGGNICNVSPSGDMTASLIALKATCHIMNADGQERDQLLSDFIIGLKKTTLTKSEIIKSISIPKNSNSTIKSSYEKVGSRKSMEIAIVSLGYHLQMENDGTISHAGIACGAVAPTIPFATSACTYLIGKKIQELTDSEKEAFANKVMEYASPISDVRASDWYRKEVLFNISQTIFE